MRLARLLAVLAIATPLVACVISPLPAGGANATSIPAAAPATAVSASTAQPPNANVLRSWAFTAGDADGWALGWSSTEDMALTEIGAVDKLGLKLTASLQGKGWGDANIKSKWIEDKAPANVELRILVPVADGKPKGPLSVGCAMTDPWAEAKHWTDLKLLDRVTVDGKEYLAQNVVCRLGESSAQHKAIVLRFGGSNVRFKGSIYVQTVRAVAKA